MDVIRCAAIGILLHLAYAGAIPPQISQHTNHRVLHADEQNNEAASLAHTMPHKDHADLTTKDPVTENENDDQVGLSTQALGNATIGDLLDDQDTADSADGPAPTEHAALKKVARARKSTDATIASLQAELHIQTLKAEREEKDSHADALSKRRVEEPSETATGSVDRRKYDDDVHTQHTDQDTTDSSLPKDSAVQPESGNTDAVKLLTAKISQLNAENSQLIHYMNSYC